MPFRLNVHVREAEPYTGLHDYDDVRAAVEEEAINVVNDLGSDILDEGTEEERELKVEHLADEAMLSLWRQSDAERGCREYYFPGVLNHHTGLRHRGVRLSLCEES